MEVYLDLVRDVLETGVRKSDRTGTGTISVFGRQLRFNLQEGFPLVTTKKVHLASVIHELLWFISGDTNIGYLNKNGVTIWDEWADENGELGEIYGRQWRAWPGKTDETIDQLTKVIDQIKTDPDSRRLIVNSWNPGRLNKMALPPCHFVYQFYVADKKLSCLFNMRSVDVFLGLPFNIASYALLTHLVAEQCELGVGDLIWSGGDVHVYLNHMHQIEKQLSRSPYKLPELVIKRKAKSVFDYQFDDIEVVGYQCHPGIKAPVAV